MAAAGAIPIPHEVPLWQAALLGCSVVTGFGAVANAARVRIGERVAVIGCGGVGLQVIAAARLAGAATIIAVDRRPEKLDHALRRGATHAIDAGAVDAAATISALTGGGVDHAFEVVGTAPTIRAAWDAIRPGGTAVVVGLAPAGVEVSLPAIEFLSEKSIIGSYYGSADPAPSFPASSSWSGPVGSSSPTWCRISSILTGSRRRSSACVAARATGRSSSSTLSSPVRRPP